MFRCVTELKGLVIDADSLAEVPIIKWKDLLKKYKCLFLVSDEEIFDEIVNCYGNQVTYKVEGFRKLFAPSYITHAKALNILELQTTEVAYVSRDSDFLDRAMGFLSGTIWITKKVSYEQASKAPDLICQSFDAFNKLMLENVKGFLGEVVVYPNDDNVGMIVPLTMDYDDESVPMCILGRYFGYTHYMNQLHPYSTAIYFNKKINKPYYGVFNNTYADLYSCAINNIRRIEEIDGVVAVPTRPGKDERFKQILSSVAEKCEINNYSNLFRCVKDYPTQKKLSSMERQDNILGVFQCKKELSGKSIVIIDDIITTGATIKECIRTLKASGVKQIYVVVLGINQLQGNYWSSEIAQVNCPKCGDKMHLLISQQKKFFYSCYMCHHTLDFQIGRKILCDKVNAELQGKIL